VPEVRVRRGQLHEGLHEADAAVEPEARVAGREAVPPHPVHPGCHACRDVDLYRDPTRSTTTEVVGKGSAGRSGGSGSGSSSGSDSDESEGGVGSSRRRRRGARYVEARVAVHTWSCTACQRPYDRGELEEALVATVHQRSVLHQTQDVKCGKCKRVRASTVRKVCECSGTYVAVESPAHFGAAMRAFRHIADACAFPQLREAVDFLFAAH
jgi:hypothetical protein